LLGWSVDVAVGWMQGDGIELSAEVRVFLFTTYRLGLRPTQPFIFVSGVLCALFLEVN